MKKLLPLLLVSAMTFSMFACTKSESKKPADTTLPAPTPDGIKLDVEQWLANEITFESSTEYENPVYTVTMDVTFTNSDTGSSFTLPAFWDGGKTWKVRFSLTETGNWTYLTSCSDDANTGLHNHTGDVSCTAYTGDLDIYKHGFVKVEAGTRYFMYDDGTPFFYLGDTHWTLPIEEIDGIGNISQELADQYGITSQFKYIMDYRANQGYTVIQSQPLGWYTGVTGNSWFGDANGSIFDYGVNEDMLAKFQHFDRYFDYIAEKGFVHAHSQFAYPEELIETYLAGGIDEEKIDLLCRYWVARYSAYPVLWTTVQEGDNDYYGHGGCTTENNPWKIVMNSIAKYDPYDHPSTCHQENDQNTTVNNSSFGSEESHSWYASQWSTGVYNNANVKWKLVMEYWNNPGQKPVVNYEGRYDHFWAGSFVSRSQGWLAYLNGQYGYGYGVQPIWSIVWADYGEKTPTSDEVEEYERDLNWVEGLYEEAGQQLSYMKKFLEQFEWWNLTPCFNNYDYFVSFLSNFSMSHDGNKLYVGYFFGTTDSTQKLGNVRGMENGQYEIRWMNCRTGEWTDAQTITVTNGAYKLDGKPDSGDWAVYIKLIEA